MWNASRSQMLCYGPGTMVHSHASAACRGFGERACFFAKAIVEEQSRKQIKMEGESDGRESGA